jgi:hypothetical protein
MKRVFQKDLIARLQKVSISPSGAGREFPVYPYHDLYDNQKAKEG